MVDNELREDGAPLIEGREPSQDFSFQWVEQNDDIKTIERGIPILEFEQEASKRNIEMEYRLIRRVTESQYHNQNLKEYSPQLTKLNRYGNIVPFKHTLVGLEADSDEEENNKKATYINASWITTSLGTERHFIATQGPLETTIVNLWKMVWQHKVELILMLCNITEGQKPQCECYWPTKIGQQLQYKNIQITLENEEVLFDTLYKRTLKVQRKDEEPRYLQQIQITSWNDHQQPQENEFDVIKYLVNLLIEQVQNKKTSVVHCSAGIGRTGTLLSLVNLQLTINHFIPRLRQITNLEAQKDEYKDCRLSIFGIVRRIREQRWGMVHNVDQYSYLYKYTKREVQNLITSL